MPTFSAKDLTIKTATPKRLVWVSLLLILMTLWQINAVQATTIEQNGIKIDFSLMSAQDGTPSKTVSANSDALFQFNITDASGTPVSGAYPAAWMQRRAESVPSNANTCKNMVKSFIGGSILAQPTLNLNTYYVMVMNNDASISVVDPLFHFGGTNLLTMVPLSSPGFDWQMSEQENRLFVSLAKTKRLAVIDTMSFNKLAELPVSGTPGIVGLQPDGQYVWVAYSDDNGKTGGVEVFNSDTHQSVTRFELASGAHHLAFTPDNKSVFVANSSSNDVTVIDITRLAVVKTIKTAQQPSSIAYSSAADAMYITHSGDGKIVSINARTFSVNHRIDLDIGIEHLRFAPNGRHAVVANPVNDKVYIVDSLNDTVTKSGRVESGPDQINFSDTLAYIRHQNSGTILMIPMDAIVKKDVTLQVVDFPGGEAGFGVATTPAAGIIPVPGENGVLVAHPGDQQIYYYKEGMAAPMGSFKNYSRDARAVLAADRSLQEGKAGIYQTVARLAEAGTYDVAFFMESPKVVHCFEARVTPGKNSEINPLQQIATILIPGQKFSPDQTTTLQFKVRDLNSGAPVSGLTQMNVLSVLAPGQWKNRSPVTEVGKGVYSIQWQPPQSGAYYIQLRGDWDKLNIHPPRQMMLQVM
ncbi:MAG: YVTN family beta-propeller protein [Phenylobacterium sp.]|jgi:YVTN family beta-propeller protein